MFSSLLSALKKLQKVIASHCNVWLSIVNDLVIIGAAWVIKKFFSNQMFIHSIYYTFADAANDPFDMLPRNRCLVTLAELRHAKFFQVYTKAIFHSFQNVIMKNVGVSKKNGQSVCLTQLTTNVSTIDIAN